MSLRLKIVLFIGLGISFILMARSVSFGANNNMHIRAASASSTTNKIMVKLKSTPNSVAISSVSSHILNSHFLGNISGSNVLVYQADDVNSALSSADSDSNVAFAVRVPKVFVNLVPNDSRFNLQWAIPNLKVGGGGQGAWDLFGDVAKKTGSVKVAIIDTGVDRTHPDLQGKVADSDFVGCNDAGCNSTLPSSDAFGHGTHVAGIIGALTNNNIGIAGVGWNVKLMSARVLDDQGQGDITTALAGIKWAADSGAKVINMSFGGILDPNNSTDKQVIDIIQQTIDYAWGKGVVLVAAAGNCGGADFNQDPGCLNNAPTPTFVRNPLMYPAASNHVISVAALTFQNSLAPYSENGNWVDVAAPGGFFSCSANTNNCPIPPNSSSCPDIGCGVLSSWPASLITGQPPTPTPQLNYKYEMGTSMASPQVAGVAALVFASNSNITNTAVKGFIESSSSVGVGGATSTVNGAVNGCAAVFGAMNNGATPPAGVCAAGTSPPISSTPFPTTFICPKACATFVSGYAGPGREKGDANCDGKVDDADFNLWKSEFGTIADSNQKDNANFSCTIGDPNSYLVNMTDFELWRRSTSSFGVVINPTVTSGGPTLTPTPTSIPVVPTLTPTPIPTAVSCSAAWSTCQNNSQCCSGTCVQGGNFGVCAPTTNSTQ